MKKRILGFFIILVFLLNSVFIVSAADIPYGTYTYWLDGEKKSAVSIQPIYEYANTITGSELLLDESSALTDMAVDSNGTVYLLDSGNSRIISINQNGKTANIISNFSFEGLELYFKEASGISVTEKNDLLIADTVNARVIRTAFDGTVKGIIHVPDSSVIPDGFNFQPTKAVEDSEGYVYVLSNGSYYGALVYNDKNEFCGFYGANEVQGTILNFFGKLWKKITQTEEKRKASERKIPYQFIDMAVDESNFLYTITGQTSAWSVNAGQIRRMNSKGKNILKTYTGKSASSFDFGDESEVRIDKSSQYKETNFEKLCIDDMGFVYALDSTFGHIFIYDSESNPLGIFGGGTGKQSGTFEYAEAIAAFGDRLYVLDSAKNAVTIFSQTEYGKLYKQAQYYTLNGENDKALELWQDILCQDKGNQLAHRGIAVAYLETENYSDALREAMAGVDRTTYALAFTQLRNEFFVNNMVWILPVSVFIIISFAVVLYIRKRKRNDEFSASETAVSLTMIRHPFEYSNRIMEHKAGSVRLAIIYMFLFFLSSCLFDLGQGFSFDSVDPLDYNAIITLAGTAGIAVLFAISNWAVCVLASGKAKLREIFIVTGYALVPLIINQLLQLVLSNIIVPEEAAILTIINAVAYIAAGIILCIGISTLQEYDFFKFLGTFLLTVIAMGLIIFILFMLCILLQELAEFIRSVFREIFYR